MLYNKGKRLHGGLILARPVYKSQNKYNSYTTSKKTITPVVKPVQFKNKPKDSNPLKNLIFFGFAAFLVMHIFPYSYANFVRPIFIGQAHESVNVDYHNLYEPTTNYLKNDYFLGVNSLKGAETKKPQMQTFYEAGKMPLLTSKLNNLIASYPSIKPTVYVWDFESGQSVNIKATEQYPAASIIKIPVLLELFRSIEMGQLSLHNTIPLTEYYRSSGSGSLQFSQAGRRYSLDHLARIMIQDSDNSATNMLMSDMGGMVDVNRAIRQWGLKGTYIQNWLPDLGGTNLTSAKDIALMLYNIDNASFLSLKSRESIVDYMSHVKNNRLIQAGLPSNAIFMHKTGDIGTMLGDAGIVWTNEGKKYIVVILAKRPYNSPLGKDFIVKASSIIYDSISKRNF